MAEIRVGCFSDVGFTDLIDAIHPSAGENDLALCGEAAKLIAGAAISGKSIIKLIRRDGDVDRMGEKGFLDGRV